MYDRAARKINFTVGCTPDHVGPGTYDHRRKRISEESYAPFLSLSNRGEVFPYDDNPGPGHYELSNSFQTIKGGSTIANKATRFSEKVPEDTPGPGAYDFHEAQSPRPSGIEVLKKPRQNLFHYHRRSLPPSIPDPKYAYGFEEDTGGTLVPQQPPQRDHSLGPAFYNTATSNETDASKLYRGIHFSKYSSKRMNFTGKQGPGPGEYDPSDPIRLETHHLNMRTNDKRLELQVPRYPENMLKTVAKESIPGPGQYSIKRDLDMETSKNDITGLEFERPGFGSQSKRFDAIVSENPGPTAYNDKVLTAFNASQSKPSSLKRTPFNQTAARFAPHDYKSRSAPGPAQYLIPGFTDENLRRAVVEGSRKPPFNIASLRRLDITRKDDYNTPAPNSYTIKSQTFKVKTDHPTANFISNTAREPIIEDTPGPTAYDVPRAYQALITQRRLPPRSKNARMRHSQFISAAKRSYAGDIFTDTPGPGAYDRMFPTNVHGFAPTHETRFPKETSKLPGPADYELSPLLQDTVLRGTFNSTLNNPLLTKLQTRALREEQAAVKAATATITPTAPSHAAPSAIGDISTQA